MTLLLDVRALTVAMDKGKARMWVAEVRTADERV